jgi:hypothetical protein
MNSFNIKNQLRIIGPLFFLLSALCFLSFNTPQKTVASSSSAWQQVVSTDNGQLTHVLLFSGPYFSWTVYETDGGAFNSPKAAALKRTEKKC